MDEKQELLEIYKLHTELADQLNKQRTTTNRFYLVIMSILLEFLLGSYNSQMDYQWSSS